VLNGIDVDWHHVAFLLAAIVPSIICHEVSHGVVALWFGDDTAKKAGRLTLNPIPHIDPFGTVLLPFILSLSGLGAFGYAKPVPVNVRRLRNPRQHSLYVSLAGPLTNGVIAVLALALFRLTRPSLYGLVSVESLPLVPQYCFWLGLVNLLLGVFNLLPIPPLDGSAMIERFLPHSWWPTWLKYRQFGFGILLLLFFVVPGALDRVFDPAIDLWFRVVV
jgi:Zn-dependent protease